MMRVRTMPGQRQLTPTEDPASRSSLNMVSATAMAACLLVLYGAAPGNEVSPAIDAVITMWPSSCALMWGRNAAMPWMMPNRFTPSVQVQSASVSVSMGPFPPATPALRHTTCTFPNVSKARAASACTDAPYAEHLGAVRLQFGDRDVERRRLDIGHDDVHAGARQSVGEGTAHAARSARDDRSLAYERIHVRPPRRPRAAYSSSSACSTTSFSAGWM